MKLITYTIAVLLVLTATACGSSKNVTSNEVEESINDSVDEAISDLEEMDEPTIIIENISANEFKKHIESGKGLLLDVRTPKEVAQGKINNATNIDYYSSSFKAELEKLDKNTPVYVYCRSGARSGKAMKQMKDLGFKEVYNLLGGYMDWPY